MCCVILQTSASDPIAATLLAGVGSDIFRMGTGIALVLFIVLMWAINMRKKMFTRCRICRRWHNEYGEYTDMPRRGDPINVDDTDICPCCYDRLDDFK